MRRPLTEEEMACEVRRAKRFCTVTFIVMLAVVLLLACGIWYLDARIHAAVSA